MLPPEESELIKRIFKYLLIALAVLAIAAIWPVYVVYRELEKASSEDPLVWEKDIARLEQVAIAEPGAVLFVGSSSIRLWPSLPEDMAPLDAVQRGFGGAKINDVIFYADRLFAAEAPAAIVIFVGTNDISPGAAKHGAAPFDDLGSVTQAVHLKVAGGGPDGVEIPRCCLAASAVGGLQLAKHFLVGDRSIAPR